MNRIEVNGTHEILYEFKSKQFLSLLFSLEEAGLKTFYGMVINAHELP